VLQRHADAAASSSAATLRALEQAQRQAQGGDGARDAFSNAMLEELRQERSQLEDAR